MITSYDPDYQQTKRIRQGKESIEPTLAGFVPWLEQAFGIEVLNLIYDTRIVTGAARLRVVVELESDCEQFLSSAGYDKAKQERTKQAFIAYTESRGMHRFDEDSAFVIFTAFETVAVTEAHGRVSHKQREALVRRLDNPQLWHIENGFGYVIFFLFTQQQCDKVKGTGEAERFAEAYLEVVKPFDEFDYLSLDRLSYGFDSKENFDNNYDGSWMNYLR